MNNRIKQIRKEVGLNQTDFAKQIGLTQRALSTMETPGRTVTDQNVKNICREFNVSEAWLRTGMGEMFNPPEEVGLFSRLVEQYHLDYLGAELLRTYLQLDQADRLVISRYISKLTANVQQAEDAMQQSAAAPPPAAPGSKTG